MGLNKKRWLALALTIIMVLGMGVPTAFAATPAKLANMAFQVHGEAFDNTLGKSSGNPIVLYMGDEPVQIDLYNNNGTIQLNKAIVESGESPAITFEDLDSSILEVTTGDGFITLNPKNMTYQPTSFTVKVEPKGSKWTLANSPWVDNGGINYFETDLYVKVIPTVKFNADKITLDTANSTTDYINISGASFTSTSGAVSFEAYSAVPTDPNALLTFNDYGTSASDGNLNTKVSAIPGKVGDGVLTFTTAIDGVPAKDITVPYTVLNSKSANGVKVGTSVDKIDIKQNAIATSYAFDTFVADIDGKEVDGKTIALIDNDGDNVANNGVLIDNLKVTTAPGTAGDDKVTASFNTNKVTLALEANVIAAEGTLVISGKESVGNTPLVNTEVPFVVKAVEMKSNVASAIVFDINRESTTSNVKYVELSAVDANGTLATAVGDFKPVTGFSFALDATNKYKITANNGAVTPLKDGDSGFFEVKGAVTYTASTTVAAGTYKTDYIKIPYTVVDNTKKPTVAINPSLATYEFDLITPSSSIISGSLTASNYIGTGDIRPDYPNIKFSGGDIVDYFDIALVNRDGNKMDATILAKKPCSGVVEIPYSVDGIKAAEPLKLNVLVKDTTPGAPNKVTSSLDPINVALNASSPRTTIQVFDSSNALVTGADLNFELYDNDGNSVTLTDYIAMNQVGTTNQYDIALVKAFAGNLKIIAEKTVGGISKTAETLVPLTITGMKLTPSVTSFDLDMMSTDTNKIELTLTADGKITGAAGAAIPTPSQTGNTLTITYNATKSKLAEGTLVYDIVGRTEVKRAKLGFSNFYVDGFLAEPVTIDYNVLNSTAIVEENGIKELAFDMAPGGNQSATLRFKSNPSGSALTINSVVSSDTAESVIKITKRTGAAAGLSDYYDVKAIGDGSGFITVSGKVGAVPCTLVINFKVGAPEKQTLVVTPSSLALDLTTNKEATLAVTASGTGVVTDAKINYTGDLITVDGLKVTAAKAGEGSFTVTGKIDGVDADAITVSFKVNETPVVTTAGFYMDDATLLDATSTVVNRFGYVKYPSVNVTKTTANTHTVVAKDASGNNVRITNAVSNKTANVSAKANDDGTATVVIKNTASTTVNFTVAGANTAIRIGGKVEKIKGINEDATDITMMVGQRLNVNPTFTPTYANNQRVTYKSGNAKVAKVSNGVLTALKAGDTTLTITSKANSKIKSKVKVKVIADYSSIVYRSAYLCDNTQEAAVAAMLSAATFNGTTNTASKLPGTSKTAFVAALNALATDTIKQDDIFAIYLTGAATSKGLELGTDVISFDDLAKELSKIEGNIFLMMDCAQSSRIINTKSLSETEVNNELIAAFAKANTSVQAKTVATATRNDKAKFKILTSTVKKAQKTNSTVFAEYLVKALTAVEGKFPADKNSDGKVTLAELYDYMVANANKAAKAAGDSQRVGVYPASNKFPVYAQEPAPVVTP